MLMKIPGKLRVKKTDIRLYSTIGLQIFADFVNFYNLRFNVNKVTLCKGLNKLKNLR